MWQYEDSNSASFSKWPNDGYSAIDNYTKDGEPEEV